MNKCYNEFLIAFSNFVSIEQQLILRVVNLKTELNDREFNWCLRYLSG